MAEADTATTYSMVSPKKDEFCSETTRAATISQSSGKKARLFIRRDKSRPMVEMMLTAIVPAAAIRSICQSCCHRSIQIIAMAQLSVKKRVYAKSRRDDEGWMISSDFKTAGTKKI